MSDTNSDASLEKKIFLKVGALWNAFILGVLWNVFIKSVHHVVSCIMVGSPHWS